MHCDKLYNQKGFLVIVPPYYPGPMGYLSVENIYVKLDYSMNSMGGIAGNTVLKWIRFTWSGPGGNYLFVKNSYLYF